MAETTFLGFIPVPEGGNSVRYINAASISQASFSDNTFTSQREGKLTTAWGEEIELRGDAATTVEEAIRKVTI